LSQLRKKPVNIETQDNISIHPNLYIFDGLGAKGFATAPLLARLLCDRILLKKPIPHYLDIRRLFFKWLRHI